VGASVPLGCWSRALQGARGSPPREIPAAAPEHVPFGPFSMPLEEPLATLTALMFSLSSLPRARAPARQAPPRPGQGASTLSAPGGPRQPRPIPREPAPQPASRAASRSVPRQHQALIGRATCSGLSTRIASTLPRQCPWIRRPLDPRSSPTAPLGTRRPHSTASHEPPTTRYYCLPSLSTPRGAKRLQRPTLKD